MIPCKKILYFIENIFYILNVNDGNNRHIQYDKDMSHETRDFH